MSFENVERQIYESDQSLENFYKRTFGSFLETGVWEYQGGGSAEVDAGDFDDFVEGRPEYLALKFEKGEVDPELLHDEIVDQYGWEFGPPFHLEHRNSTINSRVGEEGMMSGKLTHVPDSIDNNQGSDPGTLLYELREAYMNIVDQYGNEYLIPNTDLHNGGWSEPRPETLATIEVPADFDEQKFQGTVSNSADIAVEVEELHSQLRDVASEWSE